jgi:carbamoyl-phosphate synthase large subunit
MDSCNATRAFVDEFVTLPPAKSTEFSSACINAVRHLAIDLFVPIIVEREFLPLAERRADFEELGCRLWVPPVDVVLTAGDKLAFAHFLRRIGVDGPDTREYAPTMQGVRFPAYLKPRRGSGSIGTFRVENETALREAARGRSDLIVQEAVDGREFTVDAFAAEPGRVVAAVPRERIAIKAGVSVKGRTYRHPGIEATVAEVVARSGIVGPANVQGMLRDDGSFCVIEMNPRFSGTLALTTAAGINFASLLLDCVEGKQLPNLLGRHRAGVTMMRYWSEVFEAADGSFFAGTPLPGREYV